MKTVKLRTIEILTNGCLNFSYSNVLKFEQIKINEKDLHSLAFLQKRQTGSNENFLNKNYKHKFLKR